MTNLPPSRPQPGPDEDACAGGFAHAQPPSEAQRVFSDLEPEDNQVDRLEIITDGVRVLATWCLRFLIIAAAAFVVWYSLKQVWEGLLPILLAVMLSTLLWPTAAALRRGGFPPWLASIGSILIFSGSIGFLIYLVAPSVMRQSQVLYYQAFEGIQRLQLWLQGPPLNIDSEQLNTRINDAALWLQQQGGRIAGEIFSGLGIATSILVTIAVVLVLTFFFLKDGDRFLPWLRRVSGARAGWHLTELCTRAWISLGGFIRAQAVVSAVDAVFIGIGLAFLGVPMALALGLLTFFFGFIPIVGAFTAGVLAVLVALVSLGTSKAIMTLVLIVAVQQLEGNILSPLLQSKAVNLHPVIVLLSVTVGGSLFGIEGAFLAVPVAAVVAVVFRYLQDLADLRAGEKKASDIPFLTTTSPHPFDDDAVIERFFEKQRDALKRVRRGRGKPRQQPRTK